MAWHPVKKTLAIGFASKEIFIHFHNIFLLDGELMIWNGSNRRLESVIVHKTCIRSLTFNTDGARLLSADQVSYFFCAGDFHMMFHLGWSNSHLES
jgi:hypothetical protein